MLGLAFLSVPLYRMFCQKTGYGGTPKTATELPKNILDRKIRVRFTSSINRNLPWEFEHKESFINVNVGAVGLTFYRAKNISNRTIIGMATYNVTPEKAGSYFNKVACFCFEQQRMEPGQNMDMPVQFFLDPALAEDKDMNDVDEITLSYTFFEYKGKGR
jgi:cytochrome c oxidase assembly protein subunit 11